MANEKNRPPQHPGQNDAPSNGDQGPTKQRPTDASGDSLDDSGEDNHKSK